MLVVLLCTTICSAQEITVTVAIEGVDADLEANILATLGIQRLQGQSNLDSSRVLSAHRRAADEIERALEPFGYYRPRISSTLEEEEGAWSASYTVDPGDPVILEGVLVSATGPGEADPAITAQLFHPELRVGLQLDHRAYEDLKARIFTTSLASGYLDAEFSESTLEIRPEEGQASVRLVLDTGPQYFFGPITIEQDILDPEFIDRFNHIEAGQAFNSQKILELKLALTNSGYFSTVDSEVLRDEAIDYHVPVILRARASRPIKFLAGVGYGTDIGPRLSLGAQFRRLNSKGHQINTRMSLSQREPALSAQYAIPIRNVRRDRFYLHGVGY